MFCLKCGREIPEGQVFCADCKDVMERYPVKPGTVVQLPKRRDAGPSRRNTARRRTITPEEQVQKLRRALRRMTLLWVITALLLGAALYPAVLYFVDKDAFLPGQNYSLIETTAPAEQ